MSIKSKVSYFQNLDEAGLGQGVKEVKDNMADAAFDTIKPFVTETRTKNEAYLVSLGKASKGDKEQIALKDEAKKEVFDSLTPLCTNLDALANGNKALYEKAGMPTTKAPEPAKPLTTPATPKLSTPAKGEIKSKGKRQKGTRAVVHMISPDPVTKDSWTRFTTTKVTHVFTGLEAGKHWVKIILVGSKNEVESDAVSYMAQ